MHTKERGSGVFGLWTAIALLTLLYGPGSSPAGSVCPGRELASPLARSVAAGQLHLLMRGNGDLVVYGDVPLRTLWERAR